MKIGIAQSGRILTVILISIFQHENLEAMQKGNAIGKDSIVRFDTDQQIVNYAKRLSAGVSCNSEETKELFKWRLLKTIANSDGLYEEALNQEMYLQYSMMRKYGIKKVGKIDREIQKSLIECLMKLVEHAQNNDKKRLCDILSREIKLYK